MERSTPYPAADTVERIGRPTGPPDDVDQQRAFERIRLVSQHTPRTLREVAADVVATGDLPSGG